MTKVDGGFDAPMFFGGAPPLLGPNRHRTGTGDVIQMLKRINYFTQ
jgi:hypothetical protein